MTAVCGFEWASQSREAEAESLCALMPLPADYHMHTPLCRHASGEPTELAAQAVKLGLDEIGFSEHNPMIRDDWDNSYMLRGIWIVRSKGPKRPAAIIRT